MQAFTELEADRVERKVQEGGPEIASFAPPMAAAAEEDVFVDVDREAGVGTAARTGERARTAPLVAADLQRDVGELFEHCARQ